MCRALRISYNEFDGKCTTDQIFAQLVDYGRLAARSWWMELGRKSATGESKGNFNFWYAVMKNRYGWSDRAETIVREGEKPIEQMSQEEIVSEIARRKNQLSKLLSSNNVLLSTLALDEPTSSH